MNGLLAEHWARNFTAPLVAEYAARFAAEHVVVLPELTPPELTEAIRAEACDIIDRHGTTHRLSFAITDNTPRNMTTVGQPIIKDEGPLIHAFYFAPELLRLTSAVIGASSVEQLDANLDALSFPDLTAEELSAIDDHAVEAGINLWSRSTAE